MDNLSAVVGRAPVAPLRGNRPIMPDSPQWTAAQSRRYGIGLARPTRDICVCIQYHPAMQVCASMLRRAPRASATGRR